jgi:outer-membrane receptor for ferric coprogen and ferric-rhodotorulic acid
VATTRLSVGAKMQQFSSLHYAHGAEVVRPVLKGLLLSILALGVVWTCAEVARSEERTKYNLHIPSQSLDAALQEFARQSGIQIVFFSQLTQGLQSPALEGEYTVDGAMDALLSGSNLTFRVINSKTLQIAERPGAARESKKGQPPSAAARSSSKKPKSGHGSADALEEVVISTAEGLVATRVETPLREIPQTISIISHEQMREQNDTDLADALRNAPGITAVRTDSLGVDLYSRGFKVTSFHIDGGAALFSATGVDQPYARPSPGFPFLGTPDLSEFDHIEVLRGADALFGGNGNPGATVSMVRKRPLETSQLSLTAWTGSWSNNRVEADATGPLAFDGAVRGRIVGSYQDKNYFYDTAKFRRRRVFAVLEGDATPSTVVTLGGSYQWDDSLPFVNGLPFNSDAGDPHLPRSTALTSSWSNYRTWRSETYFQLRQDMGANWKLRLNATSWDGSVEYAYASFGNSIDPTTHSLSGRLQALATTFPNTQREYALDLTLTGSQDWFGHRVQIAIGADFARTINHLGFDFFDPGQPLGGSAEDFDPGTYPDPRVTSQPLFGFDISASERRTGAFASLKAWLTNDLSVVGGARLSDNRNDTSATAHAGGLSAGAQASFGNQRIPTPYLGVMYNLNEHLSVYGSYADIYRATGFGSQGEQLRPEHGVDFEVGLKGAWRDDSLNGSLVVYRIEQYSVGFPAGGLQSSFNFGINRSTGIDLELDGRLQPGWLIGSGYTYNVNHAAIGGTLSSWTPRHLLKLWTSRQLPGRWSAWTVGGDVQAQSDYVQTGTYCPQPDAIGFCPTDEQSYELRQGAYAVVNLRAGYQFDSHWRAALSVNNVFDRVYYQSLGNPQNSNWYGEPRNFLLRIDAQF